MKYLIASCAALLLASPALAALPPQYQRAAELKAAIDAAADSVEGAPIVSIEYIGEDQYQAQTDACTIIVDIVDIEPKPSAIPMVGPRQFEAVAQEPVCG